MGEVTGQRGGTSSKAMMGNEKMNAPVCGSLSSSEALGETQTPQQEAWTSQIFQTNVSDPNLLGFKCIGNCGRLQGFQRKAIFQGIFSTAFGLIHTAW